MTYFFIHTPKTSGTTFTSILQSDPNNHVGSFYPPSRELFHFEQDVKDGPEHNLRLHPDWKKFNFISGHFTFGIHEQLCAKEFRYFGVIREPVSHYISLFKAYERMPNQFKAAILPSGQSIHNLLELDYTHNMQTFFLSGLSMQEIREDEDRAFEKAMSNIEEHFEGVYPMDRFDEGLFLFKYRIGITPKYYKKRNVAKNLPDSKWDANVENKIKAANGVDIRLYKALSERFDQGIKKYPTIEAEKRWFQFKNRLYNLLG
jgi:hypothetical protein